MSRGLGKPQRMVVETEMQMDKSALIEKSSRHRKIIGAFGEHLICNWLSRSGFEVTRVDHTGIDILAYSPVTRSRFGITVKSRTRSPKREFTSVTIFSYRKAKDDRTLLMAACETFGCIPWIAVYVEATDCALVYLTSLANYDAKYRGAVNRAIDDWKMTETYREKYANDRQVKHIRMGFSAVSWNWKAVEGQPHEAMEAATPAQRRKWAKKTAAASAKVRSAKAKRLAGKPEL